MFSASDLIKLAEKTTQAQKQSPETNSKIIASQLREISKLAKNPVLSKKLRDLADLAMKL